MSYREPPFRATGAYALPGEAEHRNSAKWLMGLLLFASLVITLITLQLFQATAEGTSERSLRRAVAALTEVDLLLDRNFPELQERAAGARPGETVQLRDFPIEVQLDPDQVETASAAQVRETLLDRSGEALYQDGTGVLRESAQSRREVARFTIAGVTDRGLGFLRERNHDFLLWVLVAMSAVSLVLAGVFVAMCRGFGRLTGPGFVILAAGATVLVFGAIVWSYAKLGGGNEYVEQEFLRITSELAWIPLRDGAAFVVLGLLLLLLGFAGAAWTSRSSEAPLYPA